MANNTFIMTRPSLASLLIERGATVERVANPWDEQRTAWRVTLDKRTAQTIADFYTSIGKNTPARVLEVLKGGAEA